MSYKDSEATAVSIYINNIISDIPNCNVQYIYMQMILLCTLSLSGHRKYTVGFK